MNKQLEQELEEAAEKYADKYMSDDEDSQFEEQIASQSFYAGANSDIAKKIHQQEAVELIRELNERLKSITDDYVLAPEDKEDNEETITKAENFLNSKK
jgi:precorrin isomerase